ncbi:MAG TPA: M1 family aminopeptidase [Candidatus Angelobacter sp.]
MGNIQSRNWVADAISSTILGLALTAAGWAQVPQGIPRELARERAERIADLRSEIEFTLMPHAESTAGHEELIFKLKTGGPLLLDFREGTVNKVVVNGKEAPAKIENGHIVLPGDLLKIAPETSKAKKTDEPLTDNLGRPFKPDAVLGGIKPDELPREGAGPNENLVEIDFTAPIAPAGKAITRFDDKDDGNEYFYTLFVPMDASMAFPCFDQPDVKARFTLIVTAPEDWVVISNSEPQQIFSIAGAKRKTFFVPTPPLSTYVLAFAAGPFFRINGTDPDNVEPTIFVRQSKFKRAREEAREVQEITLKGTKYLEKYFDKRFPFEKYELVLLPGFAYGGMEHAGATFLREESILFRTAPTHSDRLNRDILLLHELTHQWFGDMVTMRWFDDLWLKEGFAQYMAYHALADLKPNENVWKRFYQAIKPAAYGIDATKGTTPIYQDIANLKDAKSAYGAIVYSKAPGVLRQLAFVLGEDKFREGMQKYLKENAFANAEWSDLVQALQQVSGQKLNNWANAYIRRRGMPQVDVDWSCDSQNRIQHFTLKQHDVLGEGGVWPLATQVMLNYAKGAPVRLKAEMDSATATVKEAVGKACPAYVFANDQDQAYGRFLLDARSRKAVMQQIGSTSDVFTRTLLWGSLWESVREAELNPREYAELALRLLPQEKDEALAQSLIGRVATTMHWYVTGQVRAQLAAQAETVAYNQMLHAPEQDMRIIWFRGLRAFAQTPQGRGHLKDLLSGKVKVPGVELRPLDRWNMVTSLVALDDQDAVQLLAAEQKRDSSGDGKKYAYIAQAARPASATKKKYFDDYLHGAQLPEDWVEQSLGAFNYWNQSELTRPYLRPALDALPQVKSERKIFFVLGWLNAFIGGQKSAEAQNEVHAFLNNAALDKDLKLKVLEVSDELDRTVRIRAKYAQSPAAQKNAGGKKQTTPAKPAS